MTNVGEIPLIVFEKRMRFHFLSTFESQTGYSESKTIIIFMEQLEQKGPNMKFMSVGVITILQS